MKILIYLHHPAHFHLFKNIIKELQKRHNLIVVATKKDILEQLLKNKNIDYINVLPKGRRDNRISIAFGLLKQDLRLLKICINEKPDLLLGTSTEITHIGKLLNIPSIFTNEDDVEVIPLAGMIAYPFAKHLLVPEVCSVGKYKSKKIGYLGYHELAYLHPNHFLPSRKIVETYFKSREPYFLIRFAKLGAHHDKGVRGITNDLGKKIIDILSPEGRVYITAERELSPEFEPYRLAIDPLDIHHVMAFATLYIGDSQTMAAEAGVLGVPFVRFNDFVDRIGYLHELENIYELGFGIKPGEPAKLLSKIKQLVNTDNLKEKFAVRRQQMLDEKIDVAQFITWFVEKYPQSVEVLKREQNQSERFR